MLKVRTSTKKKRKRRKKEKSLTELRRRMKT